MQQPKLLNYFYTKHLFEITYDPKSWLFKILDATEKDICEFLEKMIFTKEIKFFWPSRTVDHDVDGRPLSEEVHGNQRLLTINSALSANEIEKLLKLLLMELTTGPNEVPKIEWRYSNQKHFEICNNESCPELYEEGEDESQFVNKDVPKDYSVLKEYLQNSTRL